MRKREIKKNNNINYIIIGLIVIIISLIGYILYLNNKHNTEINNLNNLKIKETKKLKKDTTQDYVYDASYIKVYYDNTYDNNDRIMSYRDLVVPYINVDTPSVDVINNEIKQYYDKIISIYKSSDDFMTLSYRSYINNNTLSVILITNIEGKRSYKTYNISLEDGEIYEFGQLLNTFNLKKDYVLDMIEEEIEKYVEDKEYDEKYIETNIDIYKNNLKDYTLKYFVDQRNLLNIILPVENSSETSGYELIFTIN